ncbi:hypothetical protein Brsp05_04152 [Brucella sp. NBRC 12953]
MAALRCDHPLAGGPSVTLDDLRGEQWAVPDEDWTQRLLLQAALAAKGIAFNPVFSTNSMAMLRAYSFSSGTTSITGSPDLVRDNDANIALVPIDDPVLATSALHILTMEGRNLSPTMIRFVDALKSLTPARQN